MGSKKIVALIVVLLAVCIPPGIAVAADQFSTNKAVKTVQESGGILFGNPGAERVLFDDFDILDTARWDTTSVQGLVSVPDSIGTLGGTNFYAGRPLILATTGAAQRSTKARWLGQGFTNSTYTARPLEFEARVALNDVMNSVMVAGITVPTDSITATSKYPAEGIYFKKKPGSAVLWAYHARNSTSVDSLNMGSMANMTWCTLKITKNANYQVVFWVNGRAWNLPSASTTATVASVKPVFEVRTTVSAVKKMYVDWVKVKQRR